MTYHTETKSSLEEVRKLNKVYFFKLHKGFCFFVVLFELALIAYGVYSIIKRPGFFAYFFIGIAVVFPVLLFVITELRIRKDFSTNKIAKDTTVSYTFDEEQFTVETSRGTQIIKYSELYRIIESSDNFYLFISDRMAMNVIKKNCGDDLIEFLRGKMR